MIQLLGIDHFDLVSDVARFTAFYDEVFAALGFRRVSWERRRARRELGERAREHRDYAAASDDRAAVHSRRRPGLHHLALRAASREDVDRVHEFLVREGITVLDAPAEYPKYGPAYYAVFLRRSRRDEARARALPVGVPAEGHDGGNDERPRYERRPTCP
jgi:glyoxylase I family protein